MLKYSVWYLLQPTNQINRLMMAYSSLFNTCKFPAHINIQCNLEKQEAVDMYHRFKYVDLPFFTGSGNPKIVKHRHYTHYKSGHVDLYNIEQPLCVNGVKIEGIHLPLAYRIDKPFTPMELAHVHPIQRIYDNEISVCVADTNSTDPNEWFIYMQD